MREQEKTQREKCAGEKYAPRQQGVEERQKEEPCAGEQEGAGDAFLPQEESCEYGGAAREETLIRQKFAARQAVLDGVPSGTKKKDADDEHGTGGDFGQSSFPAAFAVAKKRPKESAALGDQSKGSKIEKDEVGMVAVSGHMFHALSSFLSCTFSVECAVMRREKA